MTDCRHQKLVLIREPGKRLRCRHCHLTITETELGEGCCPECLEVSGLRHRDFEALEPEDNKTAYRCEICGELIRAD
ncbi:MAG: hypothetical protein ACOWYE_03790 [Desulfatiglandales bacterium]